MLQLIKVNAERSLGMIEELRDSTREINLTKIETDVTQLIRKLTEETTIPEGIKLELRVDEHLRANFDPSLIRRVLDNLVSNAVEAMPKGGVLTIRKVKLSLLRLRTRAKGYPRNRFPRCSTPFTPRRLRGSGLDWLSVKGWWRPMGVQSHSGLY